MFRRDCERAHTLLSWGLGLKEVVDDSDPPKKGKKKYQKPSKGMSPKSLQRLIDVLRGGGDGLTDHLYLEEEDISFPDDKDTLHPD